MGFAMLDKSNMFVLFQNLQLAFFLLELLQWDGHTFLIPHSPFSAWGMNTPSKSSEIKNGVSLHCIPCLQITLYVLWNEQEDLQVSLVSHRYAVNKSIAKNMQLLMSTRWCGDFWVGCFSSCCLVHRVLPLLHDLAEVTSLQHEPADQYLIWC